MLSSIPPVRRRVPLSTPPAPDGEQSLRRLAPGHVLTFFGSGTQALSAALALARRRRACDRPLEVILPSYGCPDLIAASVHAGLAVRLVDVRADAWGYDMTQLRSAFSADTLAVVGVNLLGVGDQRRALLRECERHHCQLIQDSAQYLPDVAAPDWCADSVVLSFGRGKPLNLLGGGALLSRADSITFSPGTDRQPISSRILASPLAAAAFNVATHRSVYPFASLLPGLKIGGTHYSPLRACYELPEGFRHRVASALSLYQRQENYSAAPWQEALAEWQNLGIRLLSCDDGLKSDAQYLRLPLLAPSPRVRDKILGRLSATGLGASAMYQIPLNRIAGVPEVIRHQGPFPGAESLAATLFTLPTHEGVTPSIIALTRREIRLAMRQA